MSGDLQNAITLIKSGHTEKGQTILIQILEDDPQNEKAWIWMSAVVETDEMRLECLEEVLKINPNNQVAQKGAVKLREKSSPPPPTYEDEYDNSLQANDEFAEDDGWYDPIEPDYEDSPIETYQEPFSYDDQDQSLDASLTTQPATAQKTEKKRSVLVRSPWLTIWYMPRITIRAIIDTDPTKDVLMIAALIGLLGFFPGILSFMLTDFTFLIIGMIMTLILGPLIGIVMLYIIGAILSFTGLLLGGKGTAKEVRTAYAWGNIPTLAMYIFIIPIVLIAQFAGNSASTLLLSFMGCLALFLIPLALYGFYYVFLQSLAEAHQFSGWRAFGTVLLPGILFNCIIWMVAVIVGVGLAV